MPVYGGSCEDTSLTSNGILSELKADHQRILAELQTEHQRALSALQTKFGCPCHQAPVRKSENGNQSLVHKSENSTRIHSEALPTSFNPESYDGYGSISPTTSYSSPQYVVGCSQAETKICDGGGNGRTSRMSLESTPEKVKVSMNAGVYNMFNFAAKRGVKSKSNLSLRLSNSHTLPSVGMCSADTTNGVGLDVMSSDAARHKALCIRKSSWTALDMEVTKVRTLRASMAADRFDTSATFSNNMTWEKSKRDQVGIWLSHVRRSKTFEHICGCAIAVNCLIMGAMSQFGAVDHKYIDEPPMFLDVADKACSLWFLSELALRLTIGCGTFFCGKERMWNIFDFVLVSFDVSDNGLRLILGSGGTPVKNLVALRLLRIFRVLRIVRLLKFCRDLQLMLLSIRQCGRALLWALVLVALIIYLSAMYFMQIVTDHLRFTEGGKYDATLEKQWGSIFAASYTLYTVMSNGVSWIDVADPLMDIHWMHGLALFFYVFFMLFVVTNIITSIFVDTAIQSGNQDREEIIASKLAERDEQLAQMTCIFQEADEDGNGLISLKQFQTHMHNPRVRAYLRSVDLDVTEATSLFTLLDTDGSGAISITEFVFGCMRLKGTARSVDLAILMHDSRVFHDQFEVFHEQLANIREVQQAQSREFQKILEVCKERNNLMQHNSSQSSLKGRLMKSMSKRSMSGLDTPRTDKVLMDL